MSCLRQSHCRTVESWYYFFVNLCFDAHWSPVPMVMSGEDGIVVQLFPCLLFISSVFTVSNTSSQ